MTGDDYRWRNQGGYGGQGYWGSHGGGYGGSYGGGYGGQGRDWFDRAGDEVRSWFGDPEAERRRRMDEARGYGQPGGQGWYGSYGQGYGGTYGGQGGYGGGAYGGSYGPSYGSQGYGQSGYGYGGGERGFIERAGDEVRSWFGDPNAERRREMDARQGDWGAQHHRTGHGGRTDYEPWYLAWRDQELSSYDRDYDEWTREQFSTWRDRRRASGSGGSTGSSGGEAGEAGTTTRRRP